MAPPWDWGGGMSLVGLGPSFWRVRSEWNSAVGARREKGREKRSSQKPVISFPSIMRRLQTAPRQTVDRENIWVMGIEKLTDACYSGD